MTTQFEDNKYFTEELKEHSVVLEAITKHDISREVCNSNLSMLLLKVC